MKIGPWVAGGFAAGSVFFGLRASTAGDDAVRGCLAVVVGVVVGCFAHFWDRQSVPEPSAAPVVHRRMDGRVTCPACGRTFLPARSHGLQPCTNCATMLPIESAGE